MFLIELLLILILLNLIQFAIDQKCAHCKAEPLTATAIIYLWARDNNSCKLSTGGEVGVKEWVFFSERRSNGNSETKVQPGTRLWGRIRVGACFATCTIRSSSMATEIWEFSLDSGCNFCNLLRRLAEASFPCLVLWSPHPQVKFSNHLSHPYPPPASICSFFSLLESFKYINIFSMSCSMIPTSAQQSFQPFEPSMSSSSILLFLPTYLNP